MPESDTPTRAAGAEPLQPLDTLGWVAPPALAHLEPSVHTLALPNVSTPGPNAPDRATMPVSTENMAAPRTSAPRLPPIPGYVVERYVGRGGMGVVYRATHVATGRVVALKLTNPGALNDDITRERFVREVHALAAIKHPNIVPVYDAGDWHGFPYCTMEFVEGGTLNQHLDRIRTDLRAAVALMVKVARAVEALHAAGILHRDLKPLNILIGANDEPMVADFGLAKWIDVDSDLTHSGLPVGTQPYMSPEQTLGRKSAYTAACDVWALGVTLYELLTGHRPFSDDGFADVYHSIRTAAPQPMTALSPGVPEEVQAVVSKCLAKKPEDRYPTAAALVDDLERWLRGEPVSVPPAAPAPLENLAPTRQTGRPRWRAVGVVCALVAVAVLATGLFGALRDREPKVEAKAPETFAERVAKGPVKLTDEKGAPQTELIHEPGHAVHPGTWGEYHTFECTRVGIASLNEERLDFDYRVEAEVAVEFLDEPSVLGGVYVGRRLWAGLPIKHESLMVYGVGPRRSKSKEPQLYSFADLYWWERNGPGSPKTLDAKTGPWGADTKSEKPRFANVVIMVRAKEISATVDGQALALIRETDVLKELGTKVSKRQGFPAYNFTPPAFESGIGIFCQNSTCVVRNLTVSKIP